MLDFGTGTFWPVGTEVTGNPRCNSPITCQSYGPTRFERLGWIVGGEFALFYFFASFVNVIADCMFVVPSTTRRGWLAKIFSIALEIFQIGCLCPAAVFTHGDCIVENNPLGVSMHLIRGVVAVFGYVVWGFVFVSMPLAFIGAVLVNIVRLLLCCCSRSRRVQRWQQNLDELLTNFEGGREVEQAAMVGARLILSFIPLFFVGSFLGVLVVAGQASKPGAAEKMTAFVLFADVAFKVGASARSKLN